MSLWTVEVDLAMGRPVSGLMNAAEKALAQEVFDQL